MRAASINRGILLAIMYFANTLLAQQNHFSPTENLENLDYQALATASQRIDIAMYAFTDRRLAELLVRLGQQGVHIRIYRDREQYLTEQCQQTVIKRLLATSRNIQIRLQPRSRDSFMHLKAYAVQSDHPLLRDGSANWSISGLRGQDNNLHFSSDIREIDAFEQQFERLWNRSGNIVVQ